MKFAAKTTDTGVVAMVTKLAKQCVIRILSDRLAFSRPGALRSDSNKFYCEITAASYFENFRMEGWSTENNEIYLEIMPDELHQALRSAILATSMKMKLTRKNNAPYLTIDVQLPAASSSSRSVMHDVPVSVVPPSLWSEFAEPQVPDFNVSLFLPNVKTVQKIVNAMKTMSTYLTISANRKGGDMTFHIRTDPAELTTYFQDMIYVDWSDDGSQGNGQSQLSGRRVAERPSANDNAVDSRDNDGDKLYSARVNIKMLAQFLASQQFAHYRLIINVVNNRMLHFCSVNDELRFQYFIPSVDD